MGRVNFDRTLPSLEKVLRNFSGFPAGKSRQKIMTEELLTIAKKLKRDQPQPFYSMREVAGFFQAPLATISVIYRTLEREGVLSRIRSSHTMLVGRNALAREAVRGVVGLPVWLRAMTILPYTRSLVMEFEENLRRTGYLADIIFHHVKGEETRPEYATRLLRHRLDAIVLHTPHSDTRQNILLWRDRGIRMLIVQRKEARTDLPAVIYLLDYLPAYRKMATRWREAGIRTVWLWSQLDSLSYKIEANVFQTVLDQQGIQVEVVNGAPRHLLKKIRQRKKKSDLAIAFIETSNCERICNCEPQVIESISREARLAFCVGNIRVPYFQAQGVRVDIVEFRPHEIAARLTDDICRLSVLPDGVCHTFVPHYYDQEIQLEDSLAEAGG